MTVSKHPIKYKLVANDTIIEKIRKINYLGAELASQRILLEMINDQVVMAIRVAGCLNSAQFGTINV